MTHTTRTPEELAAEDLLPCPFCGGKPMLSERFQAAKIWCNDCEIHTNPYPTKTGAINVWNNRPAATDALHVQAESTGQAVDCRKAFEEWYYGEFGEKPSLFSFGTYHSRVIQGRWLAWRASRQPVRESVIPQDTTHQQPAQEGAGLIVSQQGAEPFSLEWMMTSDAPEAKQCFMANWLRGTISIPEEARLRIWLAENGKRGITPNLQNPTTHQQPAQEGACPACGESRYYHNGKCLACGRGTKQPAQEGAESSREQEETTPFQQRVAPWMQECFGPAISADTVERNHRFLEEALELVQACGATREECLLLVDYVYGRPLGEPAQEVGGVMVTLAALCLANGIDMHQAGETELERIWTKVEQIRVKQANKPRNSPLPQACVFEDQTQ